ncbi:hypothetical protein C7271_08150 [filamentous cyanobacterium CCP5]|nr:hypothetical protein C7271_08150 [filamentous cyanobacterium CCP5]
MLTVADLMTEAVHTISSSATVAEATRLMQRTQLRALIVERRQQDLPYGIVTEQDIVFKVVARELDSSRVIVQDIMRQPCIGVSPDLTIKAAALLFADSGTQRAPVVADGRLLGIISVTDILMKGIRFSGDGAIQQQMLSTVG